jgi:hypothetical protein
MSAIDSYLDSEKSLFYLHGGKYWYVGLENTVEEGLERFLSTLKSQGEILISDPVIVSFIDVPDDYDSDVHFIIIAQALTKLEYLSYKSKLVNKNPKRTKV